MTSRKRREKLGGRGGGITGRWGGKKKDALLFCGKERTPYVRKTDRVVERDGYALLWKREKFDCWLLLFLLRKGGHPMDIL